MQTTHSTPEPDAGRQAAVESLIEDLGRAVGVLRCAGSQRLLRLGVSMTHVHVLTLLRHHGAMPMGKLAEFLDGSMSNVTGIVDRMEERGLVERVRVPDDRRVVLVRSTGAGDDAIAEMELVRSDTLARIMARLDDDQFRRLRATVDDLRVALAAELAADPDRYAVALGHSHDHEHDQSLDTSPRPGTHHPASAASQPTGLARA
jgi:DNA-binding MarR family transcriptional regulator